MEAAEWLQIPILRPDDHKRLLDQMSEIGVPWVVLTLGEQGALIVYHGQRYQALPPVVRPVNPIGSGDVMLGAMAHAWAQGEAPEDIIRLGIAAGAANAAVWDAAGCSRDQIEGLLDKVKIKLF
jgi:tagatose 6-phosphate kinase